MTGVIERVGRERVRLGGVRTREDLPDQREPDPHSQRTERDYRE